MGDLWDCIERAQRQAEALSIKANVREEYRMAQKQEQDLKKLENRINDLQEQITGLKLREGQSDAPSKRAFPRYGFTEWLLLYGYQNEDNTWVIEEADVVDWLKRCGLEDYI